MAPDECPTAFGTSSLRGYPPRDMLWPTVAGEGEYDAICVGAGINGISSWKARKLQERFAREVLPLVKQRSRAWREHLDRQPANA